MDQKEIQRKCKSKDPDERIEAIEQLTNIFEFLSDRKQAWEDLYRLILDQDINVRRKVATSFEIVVQHVPDKKQALENLL